MVTGADEIFDKPAHQVGFPKAPDMRRGFQVVVNDLFAEGYDVMAEWQEIRESLVIRDPLSPDRLKRDANQREDLADRAYRLYVVAKVEVGAYMRETEATYGAIRDAAIQSLERQKARKERTKQITDGDAAAEAARLYPEQWRSINERRDRAEAMLKQLRNLSDLARSRCYTVSNMMAAHNRGV